MLVDDDPLIRRVVSTSLAASGYEVATVSAGRQALTQARMLNPDLVLLDVMMPDMDGYAVCRMLRSDPQTATMPIIMLTAMDETEAVVKGLNNGADDYITKPFDIAELLSRINAHLRRSVREISASPLTTLPGNTTIEETVQARLVRHEKIGVLYIDLTNFKPYNDEYGWLQGDQVIKLLAQICVQATRQFGGTDGFVGHIGGDDFVVVCAPDCAEPVAQYITSQFDQGIPAYYSKEDRERGYIPSMDRRGKPFNAPMVTVSIAIVTNRQREFQTAAQVSEWAAQVKEYVKTLPGSRYVFDRRIK